MDPTAGIRVHLWARRLHLLRLFLLSLSALLFAGCATAGSQFLVVDHRGPGDTRRLRETFDEAYYDIDDHGLADVVLVRRGRSGADGDFTQVIHLRSIWRPIPGRTVAHRTQINARVTYAILSGEAGTTFEGAGSLFYDPRRGRLLRGRLEHAVIRPTRELAAGMPLFHRAELSGRFTARRDPRRVTETINDLDRLFGPPRPG